MVPYFSLVPTTAAALLVSDTVLDGRRKDTGNFCCLSCRCLGYRRSRRKRSRRMKRQRSMRMEWRMSGRERHV